MRLNDPEVVRREYADEARIAVRESLWESATGPDPRQIALRAVAEVEPRRVLEVGPGRGELAERIAREVGPKVVAVDQSEENLRELWSLVGVDGPGLSFSSQNADGALLRHFTLVECREACGTVTFLDREAARRYVAASPLRAHLAEKLLACSWPLTASRRAAVFVAET